MLLIGFLLFLTTAIIFFTIPGFLILVMDRSRLNFWECNLLGTSLGFVIFSLVGYLLMIINMKILIWPIFLGSDFYLLWRNRKPKLSLPTLSKTHLTILTVTLLLGIIGQLLVITPSGWTVNGDLLFWSSHAHDASWHIALMNQMQKGWPLMNPAISGERVVNYHFFSDIAPSYFNQFFKFSSLDLYFRYFPFLYAVLFGSLAYLVGRKLTDNFWGGFWSLIFADFGGSAGFILTLMRNHTLGGEDIFWSSQPQSTIGNPPQITALILLLAFLYLFILYLKKKSKTLFWSLFLIGSSLIAFKVYAGIAVLGSLAIVGVWQIIRERKFDLILLFISSTVLSSVLYFPNSSGSTGFLIFQPWWYVRTMVVSPDKLGKIDWEYRRQTYIADGNWKRVLQLEIQAFLIFFFGNLWTRTIGLLQQPKHMLIIFKDYFSLLMLSIILISFLFPMLFLQKGVASNTSQFFQYYLLLMGVVAAIALIKLGKIIKSVPLKIALGTLLILLSLPTQLGLLMQFYCETASCAYVRPAFTKIDSTELQALNYLKENTPEKAVILSPPFNQYLNLHQQTPPVWGWSDTNYIGAFGDRATYLSDREQVDIMGYNYQGRKDLQDKIFQEKDPLTFVNEVNQTGANYLYIPKPQLPAVDMALTPFTKVFENSEIEIWRIR